MAIQNRRGAYGDFDPSKLLPGEWAVVLSGDTNASDGLACYMCFKAGVVKRMATYEDMIDNIAATSGELIAEEVDRQCKEAIQECKAATNSANIAITNANSAAANAVSVAASAQAAADRANEAAGNIEQANIKPLAYSVSGESITAGNSAEKPLIGLTVHGRADQVSTTGAQLFNKSTVTPESYVRDTDGTVVASTTRPTCASDYITLDGAESIYIASTMTSNRWGAFYNDKKEYVSGIAGYSSPITVPVGAVYIRLTVADDNLDTFMVNTGSTALPYEPYTYGVPSPSVEYPQEIEIAGIDGNISINLMGYNLWDGTEQEDVTGYTTGMIPWDGGDRVHILFDGNTDNADGELVCSIDYYEQVGKKVGANAMSVKTGTTYTKVKFTATGINAGGSGKNVDIKTVKYIVVAIKPFNNTATKISFKNVVISSSADTVFVGYTPSILNVIATPNGLPAVPVSSGGNYTDASGQQWICDEIVCNERGTGKRIQRIGKSKVGDNSLSLTTASNGNKALVISNIPNKIASVRGTLFSMAQVPKIVGSDGLQTGSAYENATNFVIVGTPDDTLLSLATKYGNCEFLYVLAEPVETDLSTEEIAALSALHTYYPTTTISNDAGCDMTAAYVTQYYQGVGDAMFYGVADNLTTEASGTSVLDAHQGKVLDNKIGALANLETTAKSSAVAAINEIKSDVSLLSDKTTVTVLNPILKKTISYATGGTQESVFVATEACTVFAFASAEVEGAVSGRVQIKFDKDGEFDSRGLGQFSSGDQYPALSISGVFHLTAGDRLLFSVWCSEAFTMNYINVNLCIVPDH